MTYLHACGVIHRDLKSPNLLVDKDWNVKVGDFGLSREKGGPDINTMTSCGTPAWVAPEIISSKKYSFKADVYSFGICLWEMLNRSTPHDGLSPYEIVLGVATKRLRPTVSEDTPKEFVKLMKICWNTKPSKRPEFAELVDTFEELSDVFPWSSILMANAGGGNKAFTRTAETGGRKSGDYTKLKTPEGKKSNKKRKQASTLLSDTSEEDSEDKDEIVIGINYKEKEKNYI